MNQQPCLCWKVIAAVCNSMETDMEWASSALKSGTSVLFGCGFYGMATARYLKNQGISGERLLFADNNSALHNKTIEGIKVVPPGHDALKTAGAVFVTARHAVQPVRNQLRSMGIRSISFDAYFVMSNLDRILNFRNNLLSDERSRQVLDGLLMAMLTGDESWCETVMDDNQFFAAPGFTGLSGHHFIDAGAYVGDTLEQFIWAHNNIFSRIYAFEPGAVQYKALGARVKRLNEEWALPEHQITCENMALGECDDELPYYTGTGGLETSTLYGPIGSNNALCQKAKIVSLDNYLNGNPATFIKADVEGLEIDILRGAQNTIKQYRPMMALSIYHRPEDLFEIAEYAKALEPGYSMALRHHSPGLMDTILYCRV